MPRPIERCHRGQSHVAYCSGPAQLAHLLSSLELADVALDEVTVLIHLGALDNPDLRSAMQRLLDYLDIRWVSPEDLPQMDPTAAVLNRLSTNDADEHPVFWYCMGGIGGVRPNIILDYVMKVAPWRVFQYYDGYRCFFVGSVRNHRPLPHPEVPLSPKSAHAFAFDKLVTPDRYFMPKSPLWDRYQTEAAGPITAYFLPDTFKINIQRIGSALDEIESKDGSPSVAADVIIATGMHSERNAGIPLAKELALYNDLIAATRKESDSSRILVKAHPRTNDEKMSRLQEICHRFGATLYNGQQLVEYILSRSNSPNPIIISSPSTALLNVELMRFGTPICLSKKLLIEYLGMSYANGYLVPTEHELIGESSIRSVNSWNALENARSRTNQSRAV